MEFNTYDLYLNQVKEDDVFNSNEYKYLKENNIDTAEIEGIDKDPDAGEIKFDKDQKISDEDNKLLLKDVTDFILDIPYDTFISILRGGTNGFQFVNNFAGAVGITGEETTDEFNLKFDKIKSDLDNAQEDSPFVTKMIAMAGQDAMYTYPIYKKLQKAGLPKMWRLPLSFALGGALAFDKKESLFVDSNSMRNLKAYIGIAQDTPIEEMYDKTVQAIEFGAFGKIFDDVIGMAKGIKTMNKDRIKQADIAVGASAATAGVVEQLVDDDPNQAKNEMMPNTEAIEEKKNPNFNDDEIIPGTVNEYGFEKTSSLVPVFKSVLKETAKKLPNKGSGEQIFNTLKNTPGLKQQELKWSGLDDFLKEKKTVTKEEVKEYLENNTLDVSEIQKSNRTPPADVDFENQLQSELDKIDSDINEKLRLNRRANVSNDLDEVLLETSGPSFNPDADPRRAMTIEQFGNYILDNQNSSYDEMVKKFSKEDGNLYLYDLRSSDGNNNLSRLSSEEAKIAILKNDDLKLSLEHKIDPVEMEKYFIAKDLRKFSRMEEARKTKFDDSKYTEPGGEDYREIIFKLKGDRYYPIEKELENSISSGTEPLKSFKKKSEFPYRSPNVHFGTKNEFAHVRFKTRDLNGQKVLTVEEMQSDIVQDMKRNFGERVTDFPFKNNWYELVTKRLIRYAADNDFDAVAIPKGEIIGKRYNQSVGKAKEVNVIPNIDTEFNKKSFTVKYFSGGNREIKTKLYYENEIYNLEKDIGSENFKDLKDNIDNFLQNDDLTPQDIRNEFFFSKFDKPLIIGEAQGKVSLYDKAIPGFMKKYGKKWNAKVYDDKILPFSDEVTIGTFNEPLPVTIIQLTDEMKQSVQKDGQALFNIFGIGSGAAIGSNAILDSDRNNTISNITEN